MQVTEPKDCREALPTWFVAGMWAMLLRKFAQHADKSMLTSLMVRADCKAQHSRSSGGRLHQVVVVCLVLASLQGSLTAQSKGQGGALAAVRSTRDRSNLRTVTKGQCAVHLQILRKKPSRWAFFSTSPFSSRIAFRNWWSHMEASVAESASTHETKQSVIIEKERQQRGR